MENQDSPVIQLMDIAWKKNGTKSWLRLNTALWVFLKSIIELQVKFEKDDWSNIVRKYNTFYWFGVSLNGHHHAEGLYAAACRTNKSAAISYEQHNGRKPFLIGSQRVYENFRFRFDGKICHITGWDKDNQTIRAVGYLDWEKTSKKTLYSWDQKQWKESCSSFKPID